MFKIVPIVINLLYNHDNTGWVNQSTRAPRAPRACKTKAALPLLSQCRESETLLRRSVNKEHFS